MITGAPAAFAVSIVIVCCVVFGLLDWHFSGIIENQKATIESLRERVDKLSSELPTKAALSPPASTDAISKPDLRFRIIGGSAAVPDEPRWKAEYVDVIWDVRIWNTGERSILTDWSFVVLPANAAPITGQIIDIPDTLSYSGKAPSVIRGENSLVEKTKNTAVGITPVEGKLRFLVKTDQSALLSPTTRWQFTFRDIYSTPFTQIISAGSLPHN